jgi:hypothetical protein
MCLNCGTPLGFDANIREIVSPVAERHRRCANVEIASCNWLVSSHDTITLCRSCRLTRTRPPDDDTEAHAAFVTTANAKRRLVFQLLELHLPVVSYHEDAARGLAFDLLSSTYGDVTTGHDDGLITVDVLEADDAYREGVRRRLDEPYRTILGHFRHEIGHYYWPVLVEQTGRLDLFRTLFGDERVDYSESLKRHYDQGPPDNWAVRHVSAYATMHPWEDWAETFAHVLHILDTLQTAVSFDLRVMGETWAREPLHEPFARVIDAWLPLSGALNNVNRSMGKDDLYPFVLTPAVMQKLAYVHGLVRESAASLTLPSLGA